LSIPASPTRAALLLTLAASACIPSIVVGDSPQDESGDEGTTALSTSTTADAPTTSGAPVPGECGDGVVNLGEACDDGNDEPNDGCDLACHASGRVEWTVEPTGFSASDLAIDPAGRILLSGWDDSGPLLLALGPDGTELWRKPAPAAGELAVHATGQIFIGSTTGPVHALTANHKPLWDFAPDPPEGIFEVVIGLDVSSDAVYVGTLGSDSRLVVRRHDITTGAVVWETPSPAFATLAEDLAVVGDRVVVVGQTQDENHDARPMLAVLDTAGALLTLEPEDPVVRPWVAAAAVGDGDLVIVGLGPEPGGIVRRLGPDGGEKWTTFPETSGNSIERVVTGPGERIAAFGRNQPASSASLVHLYDGAGAPLWSSTFANPLDSEQDVAVAGAFGPDYLVVAGRISTDASSQTWIRRFALD